MALIGRGKGRSFCSILEGGTDDEIVAVPTAGGPDEGSTQLCGPPKNLGGVSRRQRMHDEDGVVLFVQRSYDS
jgi:hypothetical protein